MSGQQEIEEIYTAYLKELFSPPIISRFRGSVRAVATGAIAPIDFQKTSFVPVNFTKTSKKNILDGFRLS